MIPILFLLSLMFISLWDLAWKAVGLWRAARNNQLGWFICIAIFNTVGILPITYLFYFQPSAPKEATKISKSTKSSRKRK